MVDLEALRSEHRVLFELPTRGPATTLYHRLSRTRTTSRLDLGELWVVAAEVGEGDDLAVLLRDVERWIAIEGVRALRYWVDGRYYILEAGEVSWTAVALVA